MHTRILTMDLLEPQKAGLRRDAPGVRYKPAFKTVNSADFQLNMSGR